MGEEYHTSNNSWRKMVIGKSNNEWISTMKSEQTNAANSMHSNNFSLESNNYPIGNIKEEYEDRNNFDGTPEPDSLFEQSMSETDPLLEESSKRRRRKGSASKSESTEDRSARLAKMSAYSAKRLACETPDQRALRLKRMSEYAAKRLAQETSDQRARRLARMSAYAAQRLAKESPEQRASRLARMSAYAAKRQAMKKTGSSSEEYITTTQQHNV